MLIEYPEPDAPSEERAREVRHWATAAQIGPIDDTEKGREGACSEKARALLARVEAEEATP